MDIVNVHTGSTTEWDRSNYFSTVYDLGLLGGAKQDAKGPCASATTLDPARRRGEERHHAHEQLISAFGIELLRPVALVATRPGCLNGVYRVRTRAVLTSFRVSRPCEEASLAHFMALDVADESARLQRIEAPGRGGGGR